MRPATKRKPTTIESILIRRRREVEAEIVGLRRDLAEATGYQFLEGTLANHPADEASDLIVAETDLSRIGDLTAELRDIDEALARIACGTYGYCVDCGEQIGDARLRILPLAQRCYSCQTIADMNAAWISS
jgi:RNA polymerase-binding transcription factor DksA